MSSDISGAAAHGGAYNAGVFIDWYYFTNSYCKKKKNWL